MTAKNKIVITLATLVIAATASGCSVGGTQPAVSEASASSVAPTATGSSAPTAPSTSSSPTAAAIELPAPGAQTSLTKTGPGAVGAATSLQAFFAEVRTEMTSFKSPNDSLSDAESDKASIAQFPVTLGFFDTEAMGSKKTLDGIFDYGAVTLFLEPSEFVYIDPALVAIDGDTATIRTDAMKVVAKGVEEPLSESSNDTFILRYDKTGHWKIVDYIDS